MDTIFMNSENRKTSKLTDKLDLRLDKKVIAISNLGIYYTWKKVHIIIINLKYRHQHGVRNLH